MGNIRHLGAAVVFVSPVVLMVMLATNATAGTPTATSTASASATGPVNIASPEQAAKALADFAVDMPGILNAGQKFLQGDRDPNGPSCCSMPAAGSTDSGVLKSPSDNPAGGLGQRLLRISYSNRQHNPPLEDFEYCQKTIRQFVQESQAHSRRLLKSLEPQYGRADQLARWFAGQKSFPAGLSPLGLAEGTNWPGWCLYQLDQAVSHKDLPACQQWSAELASTTFGLLDLCRWADLLSEDWLQSLDLQAQCGELFEAQKDNRGYTEIAISRFPGGSSVVGGLDNFHEVQHQSEAFFRKPDGFASLAARYHATSGPTAAVWLTPDVREAFTKLRTKLSPANQVVWDRAASTPFERSFMVNMLYRLGQAGVLDQVGTSLERFDKRFPKGARVDQLMDMLVYRAGLATAGMEWGDRFDERLMKAGASLTAATPAEALEEARKFQYSIYGGQSNYQGGVLTLRRALDTGRMDCFRATDMIAAVLRDGGWPGFLHVRWSSGVSGHSVAAIETSRGDKSQIDIVDGLYPPGKGKAVWPDSYIKQSGNQYTVELLGRGLDGFVVLESYIVKGPNAGKLTRRAIPYLPGHDHAGTTEHKR